MRNAALLLTALVLLVSPAVSREAADSLFADPAQAQAAAQQKALAALGSHLVLPTDPVSGNPAGHVTIVVFSDPMCAYCRLVLPTLHTLLRENHDVRIVWKDIALLGPASVLEARALLAAQAQGGYDRMQKAVMRTPGPLDRKGLGKLADTIGLDGKRLVRDLDSPAIKARLASNLVLARRLHIRGVPDLILDGQLVPGAIRLADLKQMIADAQRK